MPNEELPITTKKKNKKNVGIVVPKNNRPNFISVGLVLCGITWFIMSIIILWSVVIEISLRFSNKLKFCGSLTFPTFNNTNCQELLAYSYSIEDTAPSTLVTIVSRCILDPVIVFFLAASMINNVDNQTIYRDLTWFALFVLIFMYIGSFAICFYNSIPIANLAAVFSGVPAIAIIPSFILMLASNNQYKYDQYQQSTEAVQYSGQTFKNPDNEKDYLTPKWRYFGIRYIKQTVAPLSIYYFMEITITIVTSLIVTKPESDLEAITKINDLINCAYSLAVIQGLTLVSAIHINYTYGITVKAIHFINLFILLTGVTSFVVIFPEANIGALTVLAFYPPVTLIFNNRGI